MEVILRMVTDESAVIENVNIENTRLIAEQLSEIGINVSINELS